MSDRVQFRWLGVNGLALLARGQVLGIDPYFTRIPFRRLWFGRLEPNRSLIAQAIPTCHSILVTHAHWDHLMDVPEVMRNTGAVAFGSHNTCHLLAAHGIPKHRMREVGIGDRFVVGACEVEVRAAQHITTPGFSPGELPADPQPPLKARDYRMDACYCYRISVEGFRLMTDPGEGVTVAGQAEVLCVSPFHKPVYYEHMLDEVRPRLVIPVHWDDMFRPLEKPLRPMLSPPRWSVPPLQRVDLAGFRRTVGRIRPQTRVLIPEIQREYNLEALIS